MKAGIIDILDLTSPGDKNRAEQYELKLQDSAHLLLILHPIDNIPHPFARQFHDKPTSFSVLIPVSLQQQRIENVFDLRDPKTAHWFTHHFSTLEWQIGEKRVKCFPFKLPLISFKQLLPTMLTQELGGGGFSKAIGIWLRQHGVNALIFPSARTDCGVDVENGQAKTFSGWNMVDYRDSVPPITNFFLDASPGWADIIAVDPGDFSQSKEPIPYDDVSIQYEDFGSSCGSWHVLGLVKRRKVTSQMAQVFAILQLKSEHSPGLNIRPTIAWLMNAPNSDIRERLAYSLFWALMGVSDAQREVFHWAGIAESQGDSDLANSLQEILKKEIGNIKHESEPSPR